MDEPPPDDATGAVIDADAPMFRALGGETARHALATIWRAFFDPDEQGPPYDPDAEVNGGDLVQAVGAVFDALRLRPPPLPADPPEPAFPPAPPPDDEFIVFDRDMDRYVAGIDPFDGDVEHTRDPWNARIFVGDSWRAHWLAPRYDLKPPPPPEPADEVDI